MLKIFTACCALSLWLLATGSGRAAPAYGIADITAGKEAAVQFVDVRSVHQYIGWDSAQGPGGHIAGAVDFPAVWLDMADRAVLDRELSRRGLDKNVKTVLYDNGTVSEAVFAKYAALGFKDLAALDGGIAAYAKAGLPLQKMPRHDLFVSPEWVQQLTEGKKPPTFSGGKFLIVEVVLGKGRSDYEKGHIPGAIAVDDTLNHVPGPRSLADYQAIPLSRQLQFWNRPDNAAIKSRLEAMGITADTTVILYGSAAATTAAYRCGMIMRHAGVRDIRFINGGRPLWEQEKRPLQGGNVGWTAVSDFGASVPQNTRELIDYEEELTLVNNPGAVIVSIRSWPEYIGALSGYTYIGEAGEIANSRFGYAGSDPYAMEDYRNLDNTMFNYHRMAERWARWGITPDKIVSFHCGTGWRASETFFYALGMGWPELRVYDGGWYEWHKRGGSPRMAKGLPADAPEVSPHSFFTVK